MFYAKTLAKLLQMLCHRISAQHDVFFTSAKETLRLAAMTLAHEYLATSTRLLKMFCIIFTTAKTFLDAVTCKLKHFYNVFANVLFLHVTNHGLTFILVADQADTFTVLLQRNSCYTCPCGRR